MEAEAVAARALISRNRLKVADLTMADPVANQTQIDDLVMATCKLSDTISTLQKDAFG